MSSVADQGAGGYYYLADSAQIAPALGRELDARLVPAAQAVEVRLRLRPEVTPRKVFGSHVLDAQEAAQVRAQEVVVDTQVAKHDKIKRDRQTDAEGGMRFFMPSFARDDRHAMLVTLEVPEGTGDFTLGSVEIKYKDRIAKKNVTQEIPIRDEVRAERRGERSVNEPECCSDGAGICGRRRNLARSRRDGSRESRRTRPTVLQ